MSLRAKFAAVFLFLLIAPIIAATALELDRTIAIMVEDLSDSASLLIDLSAREKFYSTRKPAWMSNGRSWSRYCAIPSS